MKIEKINLILLSIVVLLLTYIAFCQPYRQEVKMRQCFDMAINLEKARHSTVNDLEVTNQDISSFQKNIFSCLSD
ncbi:MAG: hypothetical protein K9M36_01980 [Candidatus Pacebacteria bacterium]|nr:hypothetical protein [Candidatus Paceibacterota bacterium]